MMNNMMYFAPVAYPKLSSWYSATQWYISTRVIDISHNVSLQRSSCLIALYGPQSLESFIHIQRGYWLSLSSLFIGRSWLPLSSGYTAHPKPRHLNVVADYNQNNILYQVQMWDCEKVIDEVLLQGLRLTGREFFGGGIVDLNPSSLLGLDLNETQNSFFAVFTGKIWTDSMESQKYDYTIFYPSFCRDSRNIWGIFFPFFKRELGQPSPSFTQSNGVFLTLYWSLSCFPSPWITWPYIVARCILYNIIANDCCPTLWTGAGCVLILHIIGFRHTTWHHSPLPDV